MGFLNWVRDWKVTKWIASKFQRSALFFEAHSGRQHFHVGWLADEYNKSDLQRFLKKNGFESIPYSWIDTDEVLGMRKWIKDKYQYHLRLYKDGELAGHYEYAPEFKPIKHLYERYFRSKKRYFKILLKDFLGKKKKK